MNTAPLNPRYFVTRLRNVEDPRTLEYLSAPKPSIDPKVSDGGLSFRGGAANAAIFTTSAKADKAIFFFGGKAEETIKGDYAK